MNIKRQNTTLSWPRATPLFPPLPPFAGEALEKLPQALQKVWPLNNARRKSLPDDIAELSSILTSERSRLRHSYWEKPNLLSAYLYYFLPWNILRLCRLFAGLNLPKLRANETNWLVDAGAGSLTLPLALWLTDPARANLQVLALDKVARPMRLGADIFKSLGEIMRQPVWPVKIEKRSLFSARDLTQNLKGNFWLFSAANALNEILSNSRRRAPHDFADMDDADCRQPHAEAALKTSRLPGNFQEEEDSDSNFPDEDILEDILYAIHPFLERGAAFLAVEPGTRLGGTDIMRLRGLALKRGLAALAPCTHQNKCPLLERAGRKGGSLASSWCHFTFDAAGAPNWLAELSRRAGLAKKSLSLSPLLLAATQKEQKRRTGDVCPCRVLSRPFAAPGISESCRYGCASVGLTILPQAKWLFAGVKLPVRIPAKEERDKKSGALIVEPPNIAERR